MSVGVMKEKEYEPLTNSLDPPWVTSPWARQTLNALWKGSSVLEVHPRPPATTVTGRGP